MTTPIKIQTKVRFHRGRKGRKVLKLGEAAAPAARGRIPRVARLLALAHRFEKLIRDGEVRDYADLARLGHVTRARLTQIMNLLNLAPDIQEEILLLPAVDGGGRPDSRAAGAADRDGAGLGEAAENVVRAQLPRVTGIHCPMPCAVD